LSLHISIVRWWMIRSENCGLTRNSVANLRVVVVLIMLYWFSVVVTYIYCSLVDDSIRELWPNTELCSEFKSGGGCAKHVILRRLTCFPEPFFLSSGNAGFLFRNLQFVSTSSLSALVNHFVYLQALPVFYRLARFHASRLYSYHQEVIILNEGCTLFWWLVPDNGPFRDYKFRIVTARKRGWTYITIDHLGAMDHI
jgi:hypothetical protein